MQIAKGIKSCIDSSNSSNLSGTEDDKTSKAMAMAKTASDKVSTLV